MLAPLNAGAWGEKKLRQQDACKSRPPRQKELNQRSEELQANTTGKFLPQAARQSSFCGLSPA